MANLQIIFILIIIFGIVAFIGAVFAYLAFTNSNKSKAILQNLAEIQKQNFIIENSLKHNFQSLIENNNQFKAETSTNLKDLLQTIGQRFDGFTQNQTTLFTSLRNENTEGRAKLEEALKIANDDFKNNQAQRLSEINIAIKELLESNEKRGETIRETLTQSLDKLREENSAKLEIMRATVDEKLQGTLEKRLGESFKMVADNLEAVHKGLGEMQSLATGVGDLKRVLTNVKSRGTWGEVQLEMLLDDMLHRDQYEKNAKVNPEKNGIVEFAIKLPGKFEDTPVYLPIDAKFPQEDYERLVNAQENGTPEDIDKAEAILERAIRLQAKTISEKYIAPPHTTDFAIMYLPTEGLFAEVVRKAGFTQSLQNEHRIMVTGPTTLAATLSSLQMGFRTLAIEKRSSEVWQILGAAKAEFTKYGEVWDKLKKQLETAQNTVESAGKRTRAIERKLRDVDAIEMPTTEELITLPFDDGE